MSSKKKVVKEIKQMEKIINGVRDQMSLELFGKHEYELNPWQVAELDDNIKPEWGVTIDHHGQQIEVANTGKCVRDPITKQEYKIYTPSDPNARWYPFVWIYNHDTGKRSPQTVHRLVAQAFCPNDDPKNKREVNHIDGDKTHNWWRNLEWVTRSENIKHAYKTGLENPTVGEASNLASHTEEQIRQVCELLVAHPEWTFKMITTETGVSKDTIKKVYEGTAWKHVTKDYMPFPPRDTTMYMKHIGEDNHSSKYTNDQIRKVCELSDEVYMGKSNLTRRDISNITGVSVSVIKAIRRGKHWTHISKDYNFYKDKFKEDNKNEAQ